jgi:hypothetical protein
MIPVISCGEYWMPASCRGFTCRVAPGDAQPASNSTKTASRHQYCCRQVELLREGIRVYLCIQEITVISCRYWSSIPYNLLQDLRLRSVENTGLRETRINYIRVNYGTPASGQGTILVKAGCTGITHSHAT